MPEILQPSPAIIPPELPARDPARTFTRLVQLLLLLHLLFIGLDWLEIRRLESQSGGAPAGEVFGSRFGYALFGDMVADRLVFVRGGDGVVRPHASGSDRVPIRGFDLARSAIVTLVLIAGCHVPKQVDTDDKRRALLRGVWRKASTVFATCVFFALLGFAFLRL